MTGSQDVCGAVDHAEVLTPEQLEAARPDVVVFALCGLTLEQVVWLDKKHAGQQYGRAASR